MNRSLFARAQSGVSLIESMIVLAVVACTLGSVIPGFSEARQRRHLDGTAAQLETDIQYARSQAVASNRSVRITFRQDAAGSCYIVHTGAVDACSCTADGAAVCQAGEQSLRSVRLSTTEPVQISANVGSILFDAFKGTSTPTGTLRVTAPDQRAVHLVVNVMGRVRSCSPGGAVPGYRRC